MGRHMNCTPKMPAIKIETEKMNGWTNADVVEEICCSEPLTSTPVAKKCRATGSSQENTVNRPGDLTDHFNQCQSSLTAEHEPVGPESCLESAHSPVQNAEAPVAEGHPGKVQLPAEPCREFPSAAGRAEPSLNEDEDEDESIYFTPELYDDAEPEEQRTAAPLPASCSTGNWLECGNSTVPADLFTTNTSETQDGAEKAEAGRNPRGILENVRSRDSAAEAVEVAAGAGAEQGGSQEMDTPKRKLSLSRSRNKGVSSSLLGNSGTC